MTDLNLADRLRDAHDMDPEVFSLEYDDSGYRVQRVLALPYGVIIGQIISYVLGVGFAVAALGVLLLPVLFFDGDITAMRIGSAGLMGALAAYLLWFASRGTHSEVHVDLDAGVVREVIPHRGGAETEEARYEISLLSGVFREASETSGVYDLVVRSQMSDRPLWVARGTPTQLAPLQAKLEQDLAA